MIAFMGKDKGHSTEIGNQPPVMAFRRIGQVVGTVLESSIHGHGALLDHF